MNVSERVWKFQGNEVRFETGAIAKQADAAVLVSMGDAVVLVTVVAAHTLKPGMDFFPLTVEYREKMAAGGRIPGGYGRREGRSTDQEILTCRLIDRSIRPLFPKSFRYETQVLATVMSADPGVDTGALAILGACAGLHLSDIPWNGPAGGLRVARRSGHLQALPNREERKHADLDLVVSTGPDGLVMVEGEAREAVEEDIVEGLLFAEKTLASFHSLCAAWRSEVGKEKRVVPTDPELGEDQKARANERFLEPLRELLAKPLEKHERRRQVEELVGTTLEAFADLEPEEFGRAKAYLGKLHVSEVRRNVLERKRRLDGRGPEDIRPIWGRVSWLPSTHGSAVFTRGETQALVTCTLGQGRDEKTTETVFGSESEKFLLHYNFPPYSVGETRPVRGPGRREIGHGNLARRALEAVLPSFEEFPYVIRVESEISESNGSSSMATVCGGCLALMDCGVPLKKPVAGIAMGLIGEGENLVVLSDILGDEDHLGDMDFKVTGTVDGITAMQMDNKIGGLSREILIEALEQARRGRLHILSKMSEVLASPRAELSDRAPRVYAQRIRPGRVGDLIGPRGATIKEIQDATGANLAVENDGLVCIYSSDPRAAKQALRLVREAAGDVEIQRVYLGTVTSVKDFGCFVRIYNKVEGLVPAYDLSNGSSQHPSQVVREGDEILVRVMGVDNRGRLELSKREAAGTAVADVAN